MKGYKTLKEICHSKGIRYHTLWRRVVKSRVIVRRIGTVMLIKDKDVSRVINAD